MSDSVDTPTPDAPQPGLTIADLIMVAQIVQRGAGAGIFKADELKGIGDFYDRLIKFLETSGAIVRSQQTQTAPAADTTAAPETVAQGE